MCVRTHDRSRTGPPTQKAAASSGMPLRGPHLSRDNSKTLHHRHLQGHNHFEEIGTVQHSTARTSLPNEELRYSISVEDHELSSILTHRLVAEEDRIQLDHPRNNSLRSRHLEQASPANSA